MTDQTTAAPRDPGLAGTARKGSIPTPRVDTGTVIKLTRAKGKKRRRR